MSAVLSLRMIEERAAVRVSSLRCGAMMAIDFVR